jgi:hypothetical protein
MADHIHTSIASFRDSVLTAVAKLEFQLRDTFPSKTSVYNRSSIGSSDDYEDASRLEIAKLTNMISQLSLRIGSLEEQIESSAHDKAEPIVSELLNIRPVSNTRNILVSSVRSTPALAAAVAAASVPNLDLAFNAGDAADDQCTESSIEKEEDDIQMSTVDDEEVEEEGEDEGEEVEEEGEDEGEEVEEGNEEEDVEMEVEESVSSSPDLVPIKIDGTVYYIDEDKNIYAETEDGYEQVGTYDPLTKKLVAETADENEEDAIEVEDFVYKGKTYQRDENNNVYLDGEQIGTWNGKRIVA